MGLPTTRIAAIIAALAAGGCDRILSLEEPRLRTAGPDGAGDDGGLGPDGAGSRNLLANPTCDDSWDPWFAFNGEVALSTTAHSGSHSCQSCKFPSYPVYSLDSDDWVNTVRTDQVYVARAWVRSGPSTVRTDQQLNLFVRQWRDGNPTDRTGLATPVTLSSEWRQLEVAHTVVFGAQSVDMYLGNEAAQDGDCFLADDLELFLQ